MKQEYKENETNLAQAQALAVKVLSKTLDMTKITSEKGNCQLHIILSHIYIAGLRILCSEKHFRIISLNDDVSYESRVANNLTIFKFVLFAST